MVTEIWVFMCVLAHLSESKRQQVASEVGALVSREPDGGRWVFVIVVIPDAHLKVISYAVEVKDFPADTGVIAWCCVVHYLSHPIISKPAVTPASSTFS